MAHLITPSILLLPLLLLIIHSSSSTAAVFDITAFGAKSDGQTDSAQSFTKAWAAACGSSGATTVYVPAGSFSLGPVTFSGPCSSSRITVQIDGTLIAPSNYAEIGTKGGWILFDHVDGVSVYGGVIDGRGASLWSCKASAHNCPDGATVSTLASYQENDTFIHSFKSIIVT